jgi:4-hydroxy-tetrahydrodipicolinate synthase
MSDLGALLTAIVTPFADPYGSRRLKPAVDEDAFVRLHHLVIERGSDGIVACGTTGEASTLDDDEHLRVVELAVQNKPAGTTVIAGAGSNDTAHAVHLTERATELGADAILSVTPYYNRPNRRGIIRHYEEVARATNKPIILYNIPTRAGIDVPNDLLAQLAQIDGISAVKQANSANLALIDGLEVFAGNDEDIARAMDLGCDGTISVASHVAGEKIKQMMDDPSIRAELDAELQPLYAALGVTPLCISTKAALLMQGVLERDTVRLPMVEASDEERAVIRGGLERLGLLETGARA